MHTFLALFFSVVSCHPAGGYNGIHLDLVKLPPGFKIDLYADNVPGARSMLMSPGGILFVGSRKEGKIYAVVDRNADYRADEVITLGSGLTMPNGVAFRGGSLLIGSSLQTMNPTPGRHMRISMRLCWPDALT